MGELDDGLRRRVESAAVARLATVRPDGRPHVVPIVFALVGDTVVTAVDHKPKSSRRLQRLANVEANPAASVLVDGYHDDWEQLWWVRGDGRAQVTEGGDAFERWVDALVSKYPQYRRARPAGPVIALAVERWVCWPR